MPHPLLVDSYNELAEVEAEAALLEKALASPSINRSDDALLNWVLLQGLASAVEKIYSGCESVMAGITKQVAGVPIPRSETWHADLLRRMHAPFDEIRPAVLSSAAYDLLNGLRSFRHRERNSYGVDLNDDLVRRNAAAAGKAVVALRLDLGILSDRLFEIEGRMRRDA